MKSIKLQESNTWENDTEIDEVNGIIKNVKVLGAVSKNRFEYPESTRLKAHSLLEGLNVNLDHGDKRYPLQDIPLERRLGKIKNIRENNGTRGDLHINPHHPMFKSIVWQAKHMPDTLGLSICGSGKGDKRSTAGNIIIESIDQLRSLDLVADPASVYSLFESQDMNEPSSSCEELFSTLVAAMLKEGFGDHIPKVVALKKLFESKDNSNSDSDLNKNTEDIEPDLQKEYDLLKAEKNSRILCESLQVDPDNSLIEVLAQLENDDKRTEHIKYLKRKSVVKKPRSAESVPLRESIESEDDKLTRITHILRS